MFQDEVSTPRVASETEDYGPAPPLGFHIQVYFSPDIDGQALIRALEPGVEHKNQHEFVCKPCCLSGALEDLTASAASEHPLQFARHRTIQPRVFLVADKQHFLRDGISIVELQGGYSVDGRSETELRTIGSNAFRRFQRAAVPSDAIEAAVGRLCMIARGYRWGPKYLRFAIHFSSYPDCDIELALALDPRWDRRGHGEDKVVLGAYLTPEVVRDPAKFWPTLVREHVKLCEREKFAQNLVKNFLVCGDTKDPTSGVLLVRLEQPDGGWSSGSELADRFTEYVTYVRRPAAVALKELTDVVEGRIAWQGTPP